MKKDAVAKRLAALIDASPKTQKEIAEEVGYDRPNIITMFKTGDTRVPLDKVGQLSKALGADPQQMFRLVLETYHPDALGSFRAIFGEPVSANELQILRLIRHVSREGDPALDEGSKAILWGLFGPR